MTDLIDRLQAMLITCGKHKSHGIVDDTTIRDAIAEIAKLRKENAELRTRWQHTPPQVGDTKYVQLRVVSTEPFIVEGVEE